MITLDNASLTSPEGDDELPRNDAEVFKPRRRIPIGAIIGVLWVVLADRADAPGDVLRRRPCRSSATTTPRVKVNGTTTSYGLGPGWTAWWGLDKSSYDVFARCIYGAKVTLIIGIGATVDRPRRRRRCIGHRRRLLPRLARPGHLGGHRLPAGPAGAGARADPGLPPRRPARPLHAGSAGSTGRGRSRSRSASCPSPRSPASCAPRRSACANASSCSPRAASAPDGRGSSSGRSCRTSSRRWSPSRSPASASCIAAEGGLAFLGLGVERPQTWGKMIANGHERPRQGVVGDDLPVPDAVPHGARLQPDRRRAGPPVRHPRGGGLMSDDRTVASNPTQAASRGAAGDVLLEVDRREDPLPHAARPRARRRRRELRRCDRGEALGHRRRVRLGQDDPVALDHGPAAHAQHGARGHRCASRARRSAACSRKQMRHIWGREMAMIFQDPMTSLNPVMKIGEQITEPLQDPPRHEPRDGRGRRPSSCCSDVAHPRGRAAARAVPARAVRRHAPAGDDRHRLACGPTMLFADEPTTALDVTVQAQILDLLGEQRRERNMSLILVTHDLGVVAGHTDEIAVMYGGQLVEKAPTADAVRQHEDAVHRGADGEHPQARRPQPHPAAGHRRAAARPGQPADGLPVRAALPVRPRQVPRRRSHRWSPTDDARPPVRAAGTRSARPSTRRSESS